ncbi:hypothetical protein JCM9279_003096 [Rhodotorula babjevae]
MRIPLASRPVARLARAACLAHEIRYKMFAQLPLEVVDLIVHFAVEGTGYGRERRQRNLGLALCRTSRAFLSTGRRLLYHAPCAIFVEAIEIDWDRAIALFDVLSRNGAAIGGTVRSLDRLDYWCYLLGALPAPDGPHAFDVRGQASKAFAWQVSIVASCSAARDVSVKVQTANEATALHRALGSCMATLECITMHPSLDPDLALKFLNNLYRAGCRLKVVELSELEEASSRRSTKNGEAQLKHALEELRLYTSISMLLVKPLAAFFPVQVGILRKLELGFGHKVSRESQVDLLHLFKLAGSSMTDLKLSSTWIDRVSFRYEMYGLGFDGPVFPVEVIQLLPRLERLTISSFGALCVERVGLLAQHCPNLQVLIASGSIWLADNPSTTIYNTPQWQKVIFPEQRVAELLCTVPRLVQVYLGGLPVRETDRLPSLTAAMTAQGVELDYAACIERCE